MELIPFTIERLNIVQSSLVFFAEFKSYPRNYLKEIHKEVLTLHEIMAHINSKECVFTAQEITSFKTKIEYRRLRSEVLEHSFRILFPQDLSDRQINPTVYSFLFNTSKRPFQDDHVISPTTPIFNTKLKKYLEYKLMYRQFAKILMQFTNRTRLFYYNTILQRGERYTHEELQLQQEIETMEINRKKLRSLIVTDIQPLKEEETPNEVKKKKKDKKKLTRQQKILLQESSPQIKKLVEEKKEARDELSKQISLRESLLSNRENLCKWLLNDYVLPAECDIYKSHKHNFFSIVSLIAKEDKQLNSYFQELRESPDYSTNLEKQITHYLEQVGLYVYFIKALSKKHNINFREILDERENFEITFNSYNSDILANMDYRDILAICDKGYTHHSCITKNFFKRYVYVDLEFNARKDDPKKELNRFISLLNQLEEFYFNKLLYTYLLYLKKND